MFPYHVDLRWRIKYFVILLGAYIESLQNRYIAGPAKPLIKLLSAMKWCCESDVDSESPKCYAYIQPLCLFLCNIIKTFISSVLYTIIPHFKLGKGMINVYNYLVIWCDKSYLGKQKKHSGNKNVLWNCHYQNAWLFNLLSY